MSVDVAGCEMREQDLFEMLLASKEKRCIIGTPDRPTVASVKDACFLLHDTFCAAAQMIELLLGFCLPLKVPLSCRSAC